MSSSYPRQSFRHSTEALLQCITEDILQGVYEASMMPEEQGSEDEAYHAKRRRREGSSFSMGSHVPHTHDAGPTSGDTFREEIRAEGEGKLLPPPPRPLDASSSCCGSSHSLCSPFATSPLTSKLSYLVVDSSLLSSSELPFHSSAVPQQLAPLEVLYGKNFLHALDIVGKQEEVVMRYVEEDRRGVSMSGHTSTDPRSLESPLTSQSSVLPGLVPRMVYRVGDYILFSPYYCPCSAYAYQCVGRHQFACCKHMLALRLALQLERIQKSKTAALQEQEKQNVEEEEKKLSSLSSGLIKNSRIVEKVVPPSVFRKILQTAITFTEDRNKK